MSCSQRNDPKLTVREIYLLITSERGVVDKGTCLITTEEYYKMIFGLELEKHVQHIYLKFKRGVC